MVVGGLSLSPLGNSWELPFHLSPHHLLLLFLWGLRHSPLQTQKEGASSPGKVKDRKLREVRLQKVGNSGMTRTLAGIYHLKGDSAFLVSLHRLELIEVWDFSLQLCFWEILGISAELLEETLILAMEGGAVERSSPAVAPPPSPCSHWESTASWRGSLRASVHSGSTSCSSETPPPTCGQGEKGTSAPWKGWNSFASTTSIP